VTWKQRPPKGYLAAFDNFHGGSMRGNFSSPEKLARNERIIDMHLAGLDNCKIAKQMDLSPSRVGQIIEQYRAKRQGQLLGTPA